MARALATVEIPVDPDRVWKLIGGFDSLPDWLPYIPSSKSSEGGRVRTLANPDGDAIVERLICFDEAARSYTYAILEAPFPVSGYRATLQVFAAPVGASVRWSGEFTPNPGTSEEEAVRLFRGIYEDGLKALTGAFKQAEAKH